MAKADEQARIALGRCARCNRKRNPFSKRHCDYHLEYFRMAKPAKHGHRKPTFRRMTLSRGAYLAMREALAGLSSSIEKCKRSGLDRVEIKRQINKSLRLVGRVEKVGQ